MLEVPGAGGSRWLGQCRWSRCLIGPPTGVGSGIPQPRDLQALRPKRPFYHAERLGDRVGSWSKEVEIVGGAFGYAPNDESSTPGEGKTAHFRKTSDNSSNPALKGREPHNV